MKRRTTGKRKRRRGGGRRGERSREGDRNGERKGKKKEGRRERKGRGVESWWTSNGHNLFVVVPFNGGIYFLIP
jgi:hypothetical protein